MLFDKEITGFGELFRQISYDIIRTSTVQSRAIAGVANGTFIFVCLVLQAPAKTPGTTFYNTSWMFGIVPVILLNLSRDCVRNDPPAIIFYRWLSSMRISD